MQEERVARVLSQDKEHLVHSTTNYIYELKHHLVYIYILVYSSLFYLWCACYVAIYHAKIADVISEEVSQMLSRLQFLSTEIIIFLGLLYHRLKVQI